MEWFNFYKAGKDVAFSESAKEIFTTWLTTCHIFLVE